MDALLLDAKVFVDRTEEDVVRQNKLAAALRILQATRGTIDGALEAHGGELDGRRSAGDTVASCTAKLEHFKKKAAEAGLWDGTSPFAQPAASPLEQDLAAIEELRTGAAGAAGADTDTLEAVVRDLRALEAGADIQARMRLETAALAEANGWTEGNHAYGSTPLGSWLSVWRSCPALAGAAEASRSGRGGGCAVWGSSLGWLCFYTALCFGMPSVGVEILPCLVSAAESARAARGVRLASFQQGDMLRSSLEGVSVVVLASQCWDRALRRRVGEKLTAELATGSLVVDYTPLLREVEAFGEPVWTGLAPTSWNPRQQFFVFTKKG